MNVLKYILGLLVCAGLFPMVGNARVVFENDGSHLNGWEVQWHEIDSPENTKPVWASDGVRIMGQPFRSDYRALDLGGTMFYTNAVQLEVGEYAVFRMIFEGKGIATPDNLNHWWFSFGLRTGGEEPWIHEDLAAFASVMAGSGPEEFAGFTFWNYRSDSWTEPYPHSPVPSDDEYVGGPLSVTFYVERTEEGFGPSTIITSNHVSGIEQAALGISAQANQNQSASKPLYFFLRLPSAFDETGGFSTVGSHVYISDMSLEILRKPPVSVEHLKALSEQPAYGGEPGTVFTRIFDIKRISNEEAEKQLPASVEAQVLNLHPKQTRLFVHDGQTGMYIELPKPASEFSGLEAGSLIKVHGTTEGGGYSPILLVTHLEVIGKEQLPEAKRLDRTLTQSTSFDVDWVQVTGRPVSMEFVKSYGHYLVVMDVQQDAGVKQLEIFIPYQSDAFSRMKRFMFQPVTVSGVLATKANKRKQMTGRVLHINSMSDFQLVSEFSGAVARYHAITDLMQYGREGNGLVKTLGVVTSFTGDTLYIRDENGCIKVSIFHEEDIRVGDLLEISGYVNIQPTSPAFYATSFRILERGVEVEPVPVSLERESIDSDWNFELITMEAEFVYREISFVRRQYTPVDSSAGAVQQQIFWCRSGDRLVEATLPPGLDMSQRLRAGSVVRLTGIGHVSETKNPRLEMMADTLRIELSNESGIKILRQASWWTAERLIWGLLAVFGVLLLMGVWVMALHKVVATQTNTIGKQIKRESVLNERQRIARELHDTLEQGLTALSLQMGRIQNKVRKSAPDELPVVEKAVNALRVCQEESRASIKDLRGGMLEQMDLPSAIRQTVLSRLDDSTAALSFELSGEAIRFSLFVEHQLVRIITEAALNAARHAAPENITISLSYKSAEFMAEVIDDGCGFDLEEAEESGRFGVIGMRERARRINGELTINSRSREGTRVTLLLPIDEQHLET